MARRDDRRAAERLSHLQIVALAGEFYAETVAAHRDEPGAKAVWEDLVGRFQSSNHIVVLETA